MRSRRLCEAEGLALDPEVPYTAVRLQNTIFFASVIFPLQR